MTSLPTIADMVRELNAAAAFLGPSEAADRLIAARDLIGDLDKAAEALVRAMYLYPNYRVDSRGPRGCIEDALAIIAFDVLAEARDCGDWGEVYTRRWGGETS